MITIQDSKEIVGVLWEHYYGLGCESGKVALETLNDDYTSGHLNGNLEEWGVETEGEFTVIFMMFAIELANAGVMDKPNMGR